MSGFDKWIDRLYGETDFGRSVATSLAGMAGLAVYLAAHDWVIAAFSAVIAFPIVRLVATWIYEKVRRATAREAARERAAVALHALSDAERQVVSAFVRAGGAVLTWSQTNHLAVSAQPLSH